MSLVNWTCSLLLVSTLPVTTLAAPVRAVPLVHNGESGVWLPKDDAGRVLNEVAKVPEYKQTIRDQDLLIGLQHDQIKTATTANALLQDALKQSTDFGNHFHDAYLAEVDRSASLWNQPIFWLVSGIALGGAVAAGTAMATK